MIWGDALIAVVRSHPKCLYVKEGIDGEGDNMVAWCETHREGEEEPTRTTFSVQDAIRAGLWQTEARVTSKGRNGGTYEKDNDSPWWKYPKRMLQMRARSWCLRDVYADVLKGIQVREEVMDHQGFDNARDVTPAPKKNLLKSLEETKAQQTEEPQEGFQANPEIHTDSHQEANASELDQETVDAEDAPDASTTREEEQGKAAPKIPSLNPLPPQHLRTWTGPPVDRSSSLPNPISAE